MAVPLTVFVEILLDAIVTKCTDLKKIDDQFERSVSLLLASYEKFLQRLPVFDENKLRQTP